MEKRYGEFKCPYCDEIFHDKKKLHGHIGGAHRRNITKKEIPKCKFCKVKLVKGKNWAQWAIKQYNLICISCKRKQNRKSYRTQIQLKKERHQNQLTELKKR